MQITLDYGRSRAPLNIDDSALVPVRNGAPLPLADPAAAVRASLEKPIDYPPLRRALTPDDHIVILLDERLPQLSALLVPLLEHVVSAGIPAEAITLLCPAPSTGQPWLEQLPEALEDVRCEVHDPHDRRKLSFVATSKSGRPLFFNRTAVDAAQLIILSGLRYDPLLGHGGGAGALFPVFSDQTSRSALSGRLSLEVPGAVPWPTALEATEAAWLLGAPFFVQVLEGAGDDIAGVISGSGTALQEAQRRQEALWRKTLPRQPDTVVASLGGDPSRQHFQDLADALSCASRVVPPGGVIALLTDANPAEDPAIEFLRDMGEPAEALRELERRHDLDLRAAWQWATVAQQARIFVFSGLPAEIVEELFATPLANLEQLQRLVNASQSCAFVQDAHKTLALIEPGSPS